MGLLSTSTNLKSVDLRSVAMSPMGAVQLFNGLKENKTLTELDISGISGINRNHIGVRGSVALSDYIGSTVSLKKLSLTENGIGIY